MHYPQVSAEMGLPYREGLVMNRYVRHTFIMRDQRLHSRPLPPQHTYTLSRLLNAAETVANTLREGFLCWFACITRRCRLRWVCRTVRAS
jgi:amidophosphoribosyltransferase